jgi:hypothetical protein
MPKMTTSGDDTPKTLKPYIFHGVDLDWDDKQAKGDCPFCSKAGKFTVEIATGKYRCWSCGLGNEKGGGNAITFLRKLHDACNVDEGPLKALADERGIMSWETLVRWGVAVSPLTGDYVIPGYSADGRLGQLYRWALVGDKHRLLATAGLPHGLFGAQNFDKKKPEVHYCEGPWDGMAWEESLSSTKKLDDGKFTVTGSPESSIGARINVVATPGANVFNEWWAGLIDGKDGAFLFDSDRPKMNGKIKVEAAGFAGIKRNVAMLAAKTEGKPRSVSWLAWGPEGYDSSLAPGYDIRDALKDCASVGERSHAVGELLEKIQPVPAEWTPGRKAAVGDKKKAGDVELECLPCESWDVLMSSWRKALRMTEGLEYSLASMLATVTCTMAIGDQLWMRIVGPPSCGKSTLCEALSVNKRYVFPKSTLRGFHSGFDDGSGENHSPLASMSNKTLVVKDGDTLLSSPNLDQILSEARDVYDRVSRSSYRTKMSKDWEGLNISFILCGTASLRRLDSSELGERFLTCSVTDGIDEELEEEIIWRKVNQAERCMSQEADGSKESQFDPAMLNCMQLTGGYIAYLRQNSRDLIHAVHRSESALRKIASLAVFVAYLRARPSTKQDEVADREFGTRLASQMTRLAKGLAVVMNRETMDDKVMKIVTKVALDTANGRTLNIVKLLAEAGDKGCSVGSLAVRNNSTDDKERTLLRFMQKIKAVEAVKEKGSSHIRWRLTSRMSSLYKIVVGTAEAE